MNKNIETITKLRTGDEVVVITGKDIGKKGTLRKISKFNNKEVVNGINMVKKHVKTTKEKKGGIISKENFIHMSNLLIMDKKTKEDKESKKTGVKK